MRKERKVWPSFQSFDHVTRECVKALDDADMFFERAGPFLAVSCSLSGVCFIWHPSDTVAESWRRRVIRALLVEAT